MKQTIHEAVSVVFVDRCWFVETPWQKIISIYDTF